MLRIKLSFMTRTGCCRTSSKVGLRRAQIFFLFNSISLEAVTKIPRNSNTHWLVNTFCRLVAVGVDYRVGCMRKVLIIGCALPDHVGGARLL